MQLPKSFTTVTRFSKVLAAVLFIIFPFIGFLIGMNYQKILTDTSLRDRISVNNNVKITSFPKEEKVLVLPTTSTEYIPIKGDCLDNLYFFENKDFSLCYPYDSQEFYPQTIPYSIVDGIQNNIVAFGHKGVFIDVIPYEINPDKITPGQEGDLECDKIENITVSGFPAVRYTVGLARDDNTCKKIHRIWTVVNYGGKHSFTLNATSSEPPYLDDMVQIYKKMEQSITIKII